MIKVGKLYRVQGTIPIQTDDGYLFGAYAYHPKINHYQKDTLYNEQPLVMNGTIVLVLELLGNTEEEIKRIGAHVLLEDRVQYMLVKNLIEI